MARFITTSTDTITVSSGGPTNTNNFSLFIMIKPINLSAQQFFMYVGHGVNSGAGYGLDIGITGELHCDISFVANYFSGLYIKVNKWNGIGMYRNNNVWNLFLNGKKSPVTVSNNPFGLDGKYTIGSAVDSSGVPSIAFKGAVAEAAYWSSVLTDRQMYDLTSFKSLPGNISRNSLLQYHPLKYSPLGTNEPFLYSGVNLTRTGTYNYLHPKPLKPPFSLGNSIQAAVSSFRQWRKLMGVGF